jgi:hypothetical protein
VQNGVVYYAVVAILLAPYLPPLARRWLTWLPGPLVFIGTTYVAYHWLTDSVGGYLLGLFVIRQLARVPWATLPLPARLDRRSPGRGRTAQVPWPSCRDPEVTTRSSTTGGGGEDQL